MLFISSTHDVWQSRTTFFFGLIAATLGLGNVWRTAGLAAEHGGGVFWIVYTLLMVLIAVPIVLSEAVVGRAASGVLQTLLRHLHSALERLAAGVVWVCLPLLLRFSPRSLYC